MNIRLEGQIALVTGASRGIGKAIAESLGRSGAFIIGTATSARGREQIEKNLDNSDITGIAGVLDVAELRSIEEFFAELSANGRIPSILVNNAGIARDNLIIRMKEDEWLDVINTDLTSVYRMSRACLKGMMKARYGRIINISSVVALSGNPGQANYTAAKAGIIGFTRSLAKEVGSRGITVNTVAPGFIVTDMTGKLPAEHKEAMMRQIAVGRLGESGEVAAAVTFLASDAAAYITGETVNINGGLYMA